MVQIFGTKKCQDTKKAERWFKERGIKIQSIDLKEKGPSPGELKSIAQQVTWLALVDTESNRYRDKGLRAAMLSPSGVEKLLLDDPLLIKTPMVRTKGKATVGYRPEVWDTWPRD